MKQLFTLIMILIFQTASAQEPILKDEPMKKVVQHGLDKVYNFKFDEARILFQQVKDKYPTHPGYDFLMATLIQWEMICNDSYTSQTPVYLQHLQNTLDKAEKLYTKESTKIEGIFFKLAAQSTFTLYYSSSGEVTKTMKYAKQTYETYKSSVALLDKLSEFYFTCGIYNYYVAKYPETHPVYKPFMGLFIAGDKAKGLSQIEYASKNCIFVNTEATNYLVVIHLKYEINPEKALPYAQQLVNKFPDNLFFIARYLEALLRMQRWEEAKIYAKKLQLSGKRYFQMVGDLAFGIIAEKQHTNLSLAEQHYQKVLTYYKEIKNPSTDYLSMAYLGLGRIEYRRGNKSKAVEYWKLARQNARYDDTMKEADALIKKFG